MSREKIDRTGEISHNNDGIEMSIICYRNCRDIDVQFESGEIVKNREYQDFQRGRIRIPINRVGEISYNNYGSKMTIIKYKTNRNIDIEFDNGFLLLNQQYDNFKKGKLKSPYCKNVYNLGYVGEGEYSSIYGKSNKIYNTWHGMMNRCYSKAVHESQISYINCEVHEEWYNFQSYAKWFNENYYEIEEEKMCLDKDILVKGNKIYSSQTCIFVPEIINNLFLKHNKDRGNYAIGVTWHKATNKFEAQASFGILSLKRYLGVYDTELEAFNVYKQAKEQIIKNVADKYKDKIPQKLYDTLYNYQVEITD